MHPTTQHTRAHARARAHTHTRARVQAPAATKKVEGGKAQKHNSIETAPRQKHTPSQSRQPVLRGAAAGSWDAAAVQGWRGAILAHSACAACVCAGRPGSSFPPPVLACRSCIRVACFSKLAVAFARMDARLGDNWGGSTAVAGEAAPLAGGGARSLESLGHWGWLQQLCARAHTHA